MYYFCDFILKMDKSMFCNYEKISCEILNTAIGPDHAEIAIAELKLTLRKYGKGSLIRDVRSNYGPAVRTSLTRTKQNTNLDF